LRTPNESSISTAGGLANQSAEPTPAEPDVDVSASTSNGAKSDLVADGAGSQAKTNPTAHSLDSAKPRVKWSVQISAAPAKDVDDTMSQQLKTNGFDGYVVQAVVKGQTYYRVRVGRFDAREKAEVVRESLAHQAGYRDAYLIPD
jgi:DedD protein